jgi:L-lactate dehydrogenase
LDDWHGISDVCMSVPTIVDRRGADQRLLVPVSDTELARLTTSAQSIRAAARSLGF